MKFADNGRHLFPAIRASSFRHFSLMESYGAAGCRCVVSGDVLNPNSTTGTNQATVIPTPTGVGRNFDTNYSQGLFSATTVGVQGARSLVGDYTAHLIFRPRATQPNASSIFRIGTGNGTTGSVNNHLVDIQYLQNGIIYIGWQYGSKITVFSNTGFSPLPEQWHFLSVVKYNTTVDANGVPLDGDSGGTCDLLVYVNGKSVYSANGLVNLSQGSSAFASLGATSGSQNKYSGDVDGAFVYAEALSEEEINHDLRRWAGLAHPMRTAVRVEIEDQLGNFVDVTNMDGVDWVSSVSISENLDNPTATADIELLSRQDDNTLASLITNSKANNRNDFTLTNPSVFLELGRRIQVRSARIPIGVLPLAKDWLPTFYGVIDQVAEGDDVIQLSCRDFTAPLVDTYIEDEQEIGQIEFNISSPIDDVIFLLIYYASNQTLYGSYGYEDYWPYYNPVALGWNVAPYIQRREPPLSAMRTIMGQIGGDVKWRLIEDPTFGESWKLATEVPYRERDFPHIVVNGDDVISFERLQRNILGIRNVVRVVYPSSETTTPVAPTPPAGISATVVNQSVDGEGNRVAGYIELEDTNSIDRLQRRLFMEVCEDGASQIDTITEAYDMAIGMLQDLSQEDLALSITMPFNPEMRLNSMVKVEPTENLFTAPQILTAKTVRHTISYNNETTTIEVTGKPAVGFKRWLNLDTRPGLAKYSVVKPFQSLTSKTIGDLSSIVGNLLGRTSYFTGGKYLAIRNPAFASWSNGLSNNPDGWTASNASSFSSSDDSQTGGYSVEITGSGTITTDYIPVQGDDRTPLSVDITYKQVGGTPDTSAVVRIEFFDRDKNSIGYAVHPVETNGSLISNLARTSNVATVTTTAAHGLSVNDRVKVLPGGATDFNQGFWNDRVTVASTPTTTTFTYPNTGVNVSTTENPQGSVLSWDDRFTAPFNPAVDRWYTRRQSGIEPPAADAAYARVSIQRSGSSTIRIDSINVYRGAVNTKFGVRTSVSVATGSWRKVRFERAEPRYGGFDYGAGMSRVVVGNPVVYQNGEYTYVARWDQRIRVYCKFAVAGSGATQDMRLRVVKNATYDTGDSQVVAGTTELYGQVYSKGGAGAPSTNTTIATIEGEIELKEGDKLNVEAFISASLPVSSVFDPSYTFFTIKEESLD